MSIYHPSDVLRPQHVSAIREYAAEAERLGMLHSKQLEIVYNQQWFNMLVPKVYGGLQFSLPELIKTEEALSWADGSLGWVVTLCSGAGFFGGYIDPAVASRIFANPESCLAGSGADTGTATRHGDGYLINGEWKYASGVHHATHITVNCRVLNEAREPMLRNGEPLVLPFVLDRADVQLKSGWKYIGMVATGSDAYHIANVFVNKDRCFEISAGTAIADGKIYRYPFLQLAEATLAANLSGMAVNFADLCGENLSFKATNLRRVSPANAELMMETRASAITLLDQARQDFYNAVTASWDDITDDTKLKAVSRTSRMLARISRETVDELYPYCGLLAASPDTVLNRVWRDIHTASQHALLTFLD